MPRRSHSDTNPARNESKGSQVTVAAQVDGALGRTDDAVADLQTILGLLPPTHELNRLATEILADLGFSD